MYCESSLYLQHTSEKQKQELLSYNEMFYILLLVVLLSYCWHICRRSLVSWEKEAKFKEIQWDYHFPTQPLDTVTSISSFFFF